MDHLFSAWPGTAQRVSRGDRVLLLADFDGTLAPIVGRPEKAILPDPTRKALGVLAASPRAEVAVVSGRSLDDIKEKVAVPGIVYAGNHGLEIEGPWLRFVYPPAEDLRPVIRRLYPILLRALSGCQGVLVEDKGISLSVHYRLVARERVDEVKRICQEVVAGPRSRKEIRTTEGKMVFEIRPGVAWDKGDAVALLIGCWSPSSEAATCLAFFLGDDLTDEGGFRAVNSRAGVSVFVGQPDHETAARFLLDSPEEVCEFLRRLAGQLGLPGDAGRQDHTTASSRP